MRILAYTENYASETVTFITNELEQVQKEHQLLLVYSNRKNPERYNLKSMIRVPYSFNRVYNKIRWWLEQSQIYFSVSNITFKREINKIISEFHPALIHCHFGTDFLKVAGNIENDNSKIPILVSFYGFDVTERIQNKAVLKQYRHLLSASNIYSVAVSASLIKNIDKFIQPKNKAVVLHSGIDTNFYKRKENTLNAKEFVFLQVSSFNQKKGHKYTLEAFKKFLSVNNKYNYKFIIAGFGPLENTIREQIKKMDLENYVSLKGPVTPAEMVELASGANCFVHMSITADNGDQEGLPNVLLEAMSLELPILSTLHAGIPEIVIHGENGILCEEKNIAEYVEGFNKIADWKICPHNRARIINHFSFESHMNQLNKIYSEIASTRK